jgi:aldehyde oxidoreductase
MSENMKKIYKKKDLLVNGSIRTVLVTGEEILVDVIRKQLGMTGTKVGCRVNQCGICSVLLDDKVVRACLVKMDKVADGAKITTIEGVGTPDNLHPLQAAWVKFGAAQCGICTPGFIMAAKNLLDQNNNPTREQVRDWFQKNRNVCRCTGYKPIVDAVMAAAKVMRGEMKIEDLQFKMPADGRIYGTDYPRPSGVAKVTGTFDYGADTGVKFPEGVLKLALVQAKVSHANILSIDFAEAAKMPGVEAVLTAKDVKGTNRVNGFVTYPWNKGDGFDRPLLCDEKVFQYGDVMAIVCADTEEHAKAAAEKVVVKLEELPAYMNAKAAAAADAIEIHPGTPNVFFEQATVKGEDPKALFGNAAAIIEEEYYVQRQPHLFLEPDVAYGYWDEEERLTICSKSVGIFLNSVMIVEALGIDPEKFRFIQNNAGGTFGYKLCNTIEQYIGIAVMATGKPCYLELDMTQSITYTGKRSPFFMKLKLGCDKDGKLLGLESNFLADHGAYSEFGDLLLTKGNQFIGSGYHLDNIRALGKITFTNHAYGAPMRAYGSPQSFLASESAIDELARKMGEDPFEFRYKNLYDEAKGSTTPTGSAPDVYVLKQIFDKLRPKYKEALERKAKFDTPEKRRGVGVALGIYCVGNDTVDESTAACELIGDGKVAIYTTWEDHGQGGDMGALSTSHEALRELKIKPENIKLVLNDMAKCPDSGPAAGSRSQVFVGNAIGDACENLINAMKKADGSFRTFEEMKAENIETYYTGNYSSTPLCTTIDEKTGQFNPYVAFMYGAFVTEAEVDVKTGKVKIVKATGVYDVGKIGNKTVVEGQAYGGLAQSVGLALSEDFDDLTKHTSLMKCGIPFIADVPDDIELIFIETPRPHSKFGSSGIGEVVHCSPHAAIANAIADACGARVRDLPILPEKVLAAMPK